MSDSLLIECSRESSGVREWQEVKVDFLCLASDSSWKPLSCNSCKLVLMLGWHRRMPVSVFLVSNPGLLRLLIFHSHREACLFKGFSAQHINTFFFSLLQIISIFCWTLPRKLTFCAIQPVTHSHILFCPQWFSASCHPTN